MTSPKKVAVVTGSRADYGLLYWPLRELQDDPQFELQLIVTGAHLEARFGSTVEAIEEDGFPIARKVALNLTDDSALTIARAFARCVSGMAEAFAKLEPDLLLILGDRYEILAAAQAALLCNVPVAHIAGGDVSEGAIDDAIRHAITKLSHLHFPTNAQSAARIVQMGEEPDRVEMVGSPGIDSIRLSKMLEAEELGRQLGCPLGQRNFAVTFHPVTLEPDYGEAQLRAMLTALSQLPTSDMIWLSSPNADPGGQSLGKIIENWTRGRQNVFVSENFGRLSYLSLVTLSDAVIGNSSSGLYEAPALQTPTVNIGNRQSGRLSANSVFDCEATAPAILRALEEALAFDRHSAQSPYGDGRSTHRILERLKQLEPRNELLHKSFYSIHRE